MPSYNTAQDSLSFNTGPDAFAVRGFIPNETGTIELMTPRQFLAMTPDISDTPKPLSELPGGDFYPRSLRMLADGETQEWGMPFIHLDENDLHLEHEGRHRMTALLEAGHGDVEFPVMAHRGGERKEMRRYGREGFWPWGDER